jgi:nitric oxide synthase-interacting protein
MSPATDSPDPHESTVEQRDHNRILCYVCEADLTGEGAGISSGGKGTQTKERQRRPGLVQIKSEGTGFAGGGKNMATREGVAFQC